MDDEIGHRIPLGVYQFLEIIPIDLGEQFTVGGTEPRTAIVKLTTPIDEKFVNRTVTALLSEDAQRKIIEALLQNLSGD